MAGPVLGVGGVVGAGGIEPQAVALLAVVERALEDVLGATAPAATAAAPAPPLGRGPVLVVVVVVPVVLVVVLGRTRSVGFELGGDESVVLGPQINLVVEVQARSVDGLRSVPVVELVLALELLYLLDGDLQLVGDPRIRAALADPATDLVEMRTQRATCHAAPEPSARPLPPSRRTGTEANRRVTCLELVSCQLAQGNETICPARQTGRCLSTCWF